MVEESTSDADELNMDSVVDRGSKTTSPTSSESTFSLHAANNSNLNSDAKTSELHSAALHETMRKNPLLFREMTEKDLVDYAHRVLAVDRNADEKVITTAYKQLMLAWHPDKNVGNMACSDELCQVASKRVTDSRDAMMVRLQTSPMRPAPHAASEAPVGRGMATVGAAAARESEGSLEREDRLHPFEQQVLDQGMKNDIELDEGVMIPGDMAGT